MTSFRDSLRRIVMPRWAQGEQASKFFHALGAAIDGVADQVLLGVRARFPSLAPDDALSHIGRDRGIVRGFIETRQAYEERLRQWVYDRKRKGNNYTLMRQLAGYLAGFDVPFRIVNNHGAWYTRDADGSTEYLLGNNWDWDGDDTAWSRFWVIIYPPVELWGSDGTWGDGEAWGESDTSTWGSTATLAQVRSIKGLVEAWRAAHSLEINTIISLDPSAFDPTDTSPPLPDGTWAHWSINDSGTQVPARFDDARYWDGTP
jgi:hypothetical protein